VALPKPSEVGRDLHGALIRCQQVQHQRLIAQARALGSAEEVLQA
jgi:hypothetical protein